MTATPAAASASDPSAPAASPTAAELQQTKEAALEAVLPDHARLIGELGIGAQLTSNGGQGSPIVALDYTSIAPMWLRARGRLVSGSLFVDTLVGISLAHSRKATRDSEVLTETVGETSTAYIKRHTAVSKAVVGRRDLVVTAGLKHEWSYDDRSMTGGGDGSGLHTQILMAGGQSHFASSAGGHDYVELYGLYNLSTGGKGFQVLWHNSSFVMPTILGYRMYGGMELAWVPADGGTGYYWGFLDIGFSFEL